ncbi:MAG: spore maturation protein [Firmicutes bacterium]|nr:spore maturation protein [Bacillota bacterium]
MLNSLWLLLLAGGIITAAVEGRIAAVTEGAIAGSGQAVTVVIGLVGLVAFWSGMMHIADAAGLTKLVARGLSPLVSRLFPSVPKGDPALGAIAFSMAANLLGVGNANTPLGIRAMQEMQRLNQEKERASDAMCTFVCITASSLTIIPTTIIAMRAAAGSVDPGGIIGPAIGATTASTITAIIVDRLLRRLGGKR